MRKVLFIDRDGTLIREPEDLQVDSFEKLEFYPKVFQYLGKIDREMDYELVMVTNQDGLGTSAYPEELFEKIQEFIMKSLKNEGIRFSEVFIDRTFPHENATTRKPGIAMLTKFFNGDYDLSGSFVIGDRITDVMLAKNLGCKVIWMNDGRMNGQDEVGNTVEELRACIALETTDWLKIYEYLKLGERKVIHLRKTNETDVSVDLDMDGKGEAEVSTGIGFFDHMLEQLAKHSGINLVLKVKGDLLVDEHHTIEDVGIALGEAVAKALGSKLGMERYGFCLPMDDCLAQVAIDFGGRNWIVWEAEFKREKIGDMPTEMFFHFFKSFSDAAKCNLNIKAEGQNEHHKIEAVFKAFAKAVKMAVKRDVSRMELPSTKGVL